MPHASAASRVPRSASSANRSRRCRPAMSAWCSRSAAHAGREVSGSGRPSLPIQSCLPETGPGPHGAVTPHPASVAAVTDWPGVSYVIPVLNEAEYVEAAVRSVLAQDYPGPTEVVLALGPSMDGTNDIVARMQADDPRIQSVDNPSADVPNGLNLAIRGAHHPVIVRVDAHTELPPGYTRRAVATLDETGAANVGGVMVAVGEPGLQAAVAKAYNS